MGGVGDVMWELRERGGGIARRLGMMEGVRYLGAGYVLGAQAWMLDDLLPPGG